MHSFDKAARPESYVGEVRCRAPYMEQQTARLSLTALLSHTSAMSQNTPCRFDEVTLAFAGTAA